MKLLSSIKSLSLLLLLLALSITRGNAAVDSFIWFEFTYQGFLSADGSPANGTYDMTFTLFRRGETTPVRSIAVDSVPVMLGVFTVRQIGRASCRERV